MKKVLITTMVMQLPGSKYDYMYKGLRMVYSYLKHTNHPVLVVTNTPEPFAEGKAEFGDRLIILEVNTDYNKFESFDYTLKMEAITCAASSDADVVYWVDADLFVTGWDEDSFQKMLSEVGTDVWVSLGMNTTFLRNNNPLNCPGMPDRDVLFSIREDRIAFHNNDSLKTMIEMWQNYNWDVLLEDPNSDEEHWRTAPGSDGVVFGESIYRNQITFQQVPHNTYDFTDYELVELKEGGTLLDRWWGWTEDNFKEINEHNEEHYNNNTLFTIT